MITPGQIIGNYQIVEKIGEGGMGEVFKGLDLILKRDLAVKVLRPELSNNEELLERFRQEAIILAKLNHQNIATLYGFLGTYSPYCMIMEFAYGETLLKIVKRHPTGLPFTVAMELFDQILAAIAHAHSRGIIHRDIKPANIMVNASQEVKVMDFGIGRILDDQQLTRTGMLVGTAKYMSPDQILGKKVDARSDVYSLGILVYEILTGHIPFNANSEYEIFRAHVEIVPRTISELQVPVPPAVDAVLMRALAKDPEARFTDAGDFRRQLNQAIKESERKGWGDRVGDDKTRLQPKPFKFGNSRRNAAYLMIAASVSALAAGLYAHMDWLDNLLNTGPVATQSADDVAELKAKRKAEAKRQAELEAQRKAEAEAKRQTELEAQRKAEVEAKRQAELEAQRKAEAEAKRQAELEAQRKAEAEAKRQAELEAQRKAEAEAKRQAELEAQRKAEAEAKRQAELEAQRKAEAEAKRQAELETQRKAEVEAKRQAELDVQRKAEAEAKRQTELEAQRKAEAQAKRKIELDAQRKAKAAAKLRAEQQAVIESENQRQAEIEAKRRLEQGAARQAELEAQRKAASAARHQAELEAQKKAEEEARRQAELEAQRKADAEPRKPKQSDPHIFIPPAL